MNNRMALNVVLLGTLAGPLGGCGGGSGSSGTLNLGVKDAPVDTLAKVVVQFDGVEVKPQNGAALSIDFDTPRQIDLLQLQGTDYASLLSNYTLQAGNYNWLRLKVSAVEDGTLDSYVELPGGAQYELYIPSGAETGLKLVGGFVVPAGGVANYTIDFDLRKSVLPPGGISAAYKLKPALRFVADDTTGHVMGTVGSVDMGAAACDGTGYAVYVFDGAGVTPDDVDGIAPDPVASALVHYNATASEYEYVAGFLPAGDYTLAFTCEADLDQPETSESIAFVDTANVTITAGETAIVNFN